MAKFFQLLILLASLHLTAADNLDFGIPGPADTIVDRDGYAIGYSEQHEQPRWIAYKLTAAEVLNPVAKRGNDFRPDPLIPTGSATAEDYAASGYDRGHLAPAADLAFSAETMRDSFYFSNMSPQRPEFNRGVWKRLERQVRHFAVTEGEIYVITGPVLPDHPTITIGPNCVTVPDEFFKVIYAPGNRKMIAFIVPNAGSTAALQTFTITVDAVEQKTGLDFFPELPVRIQDALENTITIDAWDWVD